MRKRGRLIIGVGLWAIVLVAGVFAWYEFGTSDALSDGQERLTVAYQGTLPDSFKPGTEVIVEGNHQSGRLEAYGLVTKSLCNLCHS